MKKTIILLISFISLAFFVAYEENFKERQAEALIWAAYEGDLIGVKNLMEDGAETNYGIYITDPKRHYQQALFTLPLAAASGGNEKILRHLIKNKVANHAPNDKNWTPLLIAVRDGHAEYAAQLIENGADINAQTDSGATALILAFVTDFPEEKQRLSIIEYMLKKEADPNKQTLLQSDALFYAVTELNCLEGVKLLLEYEADVCRLYEGKNIVEISKDNEIRSLLKEAYEKQCRHQ